MRSTLFAGSVCLTSLQSHTFLVTNCIPGGHLVSHISPHVPTCPTYTVLPHSHRSSLIILPHCMPRSMAQPMLFDLLDANHPDCLMFQEHRFRVFDSSPAYSRAVSRSNVSHNLLHSGPYTLYVPSSLFAKLAFLRSGSQSMSLEGPLQIVHQVPALHRCHV